jgi:hypothetical protein
LAWVDSLQSMVIVQAQTRRQRRRRTSLGRMRQGLMALAWLAAGSGLMLGLSQLPSRLDTVLFFSTALGNITTGLLNLITGLLQLSGALLLLALVGCSLVLLLGGLLRLCRLFGLEPSAAAAGSDQLRGGISGRAQSRRASAPSYLLQRH